jgi:CheY-like chemotaxis protein
MITHETARTDRALLANLRHELRTPLNAIIGYSEMLLEDAEAHGQPGWVPDLERVHTAGRQLLELVNQILDPAKVEAGALDMDLATLEAGLRLELLTPITAAIGYAEMLLEDAREGDAADMVPDLERILTAARRFLALIGDIVHFPLRQAGEMPGGSGDAVAMVREVVSTVRSLESEAPGPGRRERGYLLVVDDNALNRDLLARQLEREGHRVELAEDGRQALAMIEEGGRFDLVLLDLMMPGMNGYEVLQHLKGDAALRDIPVIMISALDELDSVVRCLEAGAEDYLPKPFNPVVLRARIETSLEKKRLRDAEVAYLRDVARVTGAAGAVEAGSFAAEDLDPVSARTDALGQLARVFQRMAHEVYAREQRLKQQVQQLRIELDEARQARQVAEITDSDYFQQLQATAADLRKIVDGA